MIGGARTAAALACLALTAGCGTATTDYQSLWTTSATSAPPEEPVPIGMYLEKKGVTAQPVKPESLTDLTVSIPMPKGWSRRQNPKLPATTEVISKGGAELPTAVLSVMRLDGDFDPAEAVKHGTADIGIEFNRLDASTDDFHGFPSAMIQGSHDMGGQRLHSWYRMVIPTGSPPANQRYLVELSVITRAEKAAEQAPDVENIINGFTVADK
ncbi:MAG TPA: LpqN/LpqT family lipoprotein [Mycobacterium sp.]|nr:LpqN/LpqT family lipoprotein [Mycobacterium sp.]